ncbi:MAG: hypothetical protein OEM91_14075, partial [Hyphomicrobiales bacterium]|nr:hypothetical protein [Hyphomicrobiales bacterium]
ITAIQTELVRVGCTPGRADGDWGARTRKAMSNFNRQAKLDVPVGRPSMTALKALQAQTGIICKAVAAEPTPPVKQRQAATPPPPAAKKPPVTVKRKPQKRDRYWGGEDTRVDCEFRGAWGSDCFPGKKRN